MTPLTREEQSALMERLADKHKLRVKERPSPRQFEPVALPQAPLSYREIEVLVLIAEGMTNTEIAKHMFLAEETIKSHVRHVLGKLEAKNRAHAVALGYQQNILAA